MKKTLFSKNKYGFTMVELMVVIAILGILTLLVTLSVISSVENSVISADQATVRILNSVTPLYRMNTTSLDDFDDETKNNEELIQVLIDNGHLKEMVEPQSEDATFAWIYENQIWYLLFEDSFHNISLDEGLSFQDNRDGWLVGDYTGSSKDIVLSRTFNNVIINEIGQDSFNDKNLVSVSFTADSQVTVIQKRAFRNNALTEIVLPDSLETIESYAFRNNDDLSKIVIGSNVDIGYNAFHTDNKFKEAYESNDKSAGTYLYTNGAWIKQ